MADNTIIQQGAFLSDGGATSLLIRSDLDWMNVINMTEAAAANASHGVTYEWRRAFAQGDGLVTLRNAAATAVDISTSAALGVGGFTLFNTTDQGVGPAIAVTNISNAGLVLTANTASLSVGDVVRLINLSVAPQISGVDFTVTAINPGVSFNVDVPVPFTGGATTGFYRRLNYNPIFYPRARTVLSVSQAAAPLIVTSVRHEFTAGQQVMFVMPRVTAVAYGMTELDGFINQYNTVAPLTATITTIVSDQSFRINIDTSAFTAFAWPLAASTRFTFAQVLPVGEAAVAGFANNLDDATVNTGAIGITLAGGITSPAGSNGDSIWWVAGKSFSVS